MQRLILSVVISTLIMAGCPAGDVCEEAPAPSVLVNESPVQVTAGSDLLLTGTLDSEARVKQLLVGGTVAKGTSDNYATWEVKIPAARFQNVEGTWSLDAEVTYCDGNPLTTHLEDVVISVPALALSLKGVPDECYIGANGRGEATITAIADKKFEGTRVSLSTIEGAQILPTGNVFLDQQGAIPATSLVSTTKSDIAVTVTGTVGNRSFASAPILIAAPPAFDADPKAISNGVDLPLFVKTRGRFASCSADLPPGGVASLSKSGQDADLSDEPTLIDVEGCGQQVLIRVAFAAGTAAGTSMVITCTDTYGQATNRVVSSLGDPQ